MTTVMRGLLPLLCLVPLATLGACPTTTTTEAQETTPAPTCATPASAETVRVFEGLAPSCVGCHASGERGFFASVAAFQSLVVADARYVTPGDGAGSELVKLLLGNGTGAFTQMPIGDASYAQLVDDGSAALTVDEVKAWIDGLSAQARSPDPDKDAPRVTRLSAVQVRRALYQQLGLSNDDFFITAAEFGIEMAESRGDDRYPLLSPDDVPAPRQRITAERHLGLGGSTFIQQARADASTSPNFVNNLVQLSQAWCRMAVGKAGNTALFPDGAPPALSGNVDDDKGAVVGVLHRWSRSFHAVDLSDAEADDLYATLFVPLLADPEADAQSPWAGTCSYFIRHPRWLFF